MCSDAHSITLKKGEHFLYMPSIFVVAQIALPLLITGTPYTPPSVKTVMTGVTCQLILTVLCHLSFSYARAFVYNGSYICVNVCVLV